jgi:hypothetical protein
LSGAEVMETPVEVARSAEPVLECRVALLISVSMTNHGY